MEALEDLQEEESKRGRKGKKNKKNERKNRRRQRKAKRTHSHIHIPHGNSGETDDIDVVNEFYKMSEEEQAEIMIVLKPVAFFRCIMTDFQQACNIYIEEHTESAIEKIESLPN